MLPRDKMAPHALPGKTERWKMGVWLQRRVRKNSFRALRMASPRAVSAERPSPIQTFQDPGAFFPTLGAQWCRLFADSRRTPSPDRRRKAAARPLQPASRRSEGLRPQLRTAWDHLRWGAAEKFFSFPRVVPRSPQPQQPRQPSPMAPEPEPRSPHDPCARATAAATTAHATRQRSLARRTRSSTPTPEPQPPTIAPPQWMKN
mmetsp:Transcript_4429/g.15396  ORF Transcript_4429/g.15396 Transcript_4429/m.15396 type:complete len:203 (+) Transcript_4429:2511-3119(+)